MSEDPFKAIRRRTFLSTGLAAGLSSLLGNASALEAAFAAILDERTDPVSWGEGCVLCNVVKHRQLPDRGFLAPTRSPWPSPLLAAAASPGPHGQDAVGTLPPNAGGKTVVIQPSWVLVPDGAKLKLLRDHEVVIKGDLIQEVRPHRSGRDRRVNAWGQILMPGFISGHTHSAAGTMTRGFIEENSLAAVKGDPALPSRSLLRPMQLMEELSDEELDDLTALNLAEMLRSGCTAQVEMSLSLKQMKSYVRVARRFGIRGYPAGMVPAIDRLLPIWGRATDKVLLDSVPETLSEIEANLAFARAINGSDDGRIRPMMAPSVVSVHTRATFEAIRAAAIELGNGTHIHLQNGWDPNDRAALERVWSSREVPILQEVGLLDDNMFGAHLLGIDFEKDLPILAESDFTFAYCPSAAGAGVLPSSQPYPEAIAAGVNTSIGLDTHSNDYLENIKLGVMQGRARAHLLANSSPVALMEPTIWTGLESATLGGARGLGRSDLGRIEPGAKADLCTVDVTGLLVGNGTLPREPYNNLMYANGLSIRNVMTDGRWQVVGGKVIVDEQARIVARGGEVVRKVWSQLESEGFFVPMPR